MKMLTLPIAVTLVLCLCLAVYSLCNEGVAAQIKAVVIENLKATESEDIDAVLETMHTQAPNYFSTKQLIVSIFETYHLRYDLLSFSYVGQDGKYAIARIKQSTRKVSGPTFQNNDLDAIHVFRKENGKWKFWNMAILEMTYTN